MPYYCVAAGCTNVPDAKRNISLHQFPPNDDNRPFEKKRRRAWIKFVLTKRAKWSPSGNSRLCSEHFKPDDFDSAFINLTEGSFSTRKTLKKDAIPSIHAETKKAKESVESTIASSSSSKREHRRIIRDLLKEDHMPAPVHAPTSSEATPSTSGLTREEIEQYSTDSTGGLQFVEDQPVELFRDDSSQTPGCIGCKKLGSVNRQLRNYIIDLKKKLKEGKDEDLQIPAPPDITENTEGIDDGDHSDEEMVVEEEPPLSYISSPEYNLFSDSEMQSTTETESETDDEQRETKSCDSGNLRSQPKFIVFLSQLLLLFNICPTCKTGNPSVRTKVLGTMVEVTTQCLNPQCSKPTNVWESQPNMTGNKMPAMNFLLCFSILVSGASPSKVFQVFKHMGLSCISLKTYFKHQGEKLFPTIYLFWKTYQEHMFTQLRETGQPLVIAGDGRHDSMGHSAKYCAYTVFCCTLPLIIDFSLVQRNVAGSSPAMEFLAFQNCMDSLNTCGLVLGTFITDRHSSIIKHMREQLGHITHYFDLWHLKKKIHKVLMKISKEKDCAGLTEWIKPCENHFMWSATSTQSGDGDVIWAKFKSFFAHVINKHSDLEDPLFNRCSHGEEITARKWLEEDTTVYEKMFKGLNHPSLVKGIHKASPMAQTSCLEGFHSVVNQYAPKMIAYSYQGMYCRHILAATHFNNNLNRDVKKNEDGTEQVKIVYPKFKNGEGTVRNVRVQPNYDYIDDIYNTFLKAQQQQTISAAIEELEAMTPQPMNVMLEKQPRQEAIEIWKRRKTIEVVDVPPTTPVSEVQAMSDAMNMQAAVANKAQPRCRICKNPMKGHKNIKDCPKNKETN